MYVCELHPIIFNCFVIIRESGAKQEHVYALCSLNGLVVVPREYLIYGRVPIYVRADVVEIEIIVSELDHPDLFLPSHSLQADTPFGANAVFR